MAPGFVGLAISSSYIEFVGLASRRVANCPLLAQQRKLSEVQKAVRESVRNEGMAKPACIIHYGIFFATQLLEYGYYIRTALNLLGHRDVRTTMNYTHVVSRAAGEIKVQQIGCIKSEIAYFLLDRLLARRRDRLLDRRQLPKKLALTFKLQVSDTVYEIVI